MELVAFGISNSEHEEVFTLICTYMIYEPRVV